MWTLWIRWGVGAGPRLRAGRRAGCTSTACGQKKVRIRKSQALLLAALRGPTQYVPLLRYDRVRVREEHRIRAGPSGRCRTRPLRITSAAEAPSDDVRYTSNEDTRTAPDGRDGRTFGDDNERRQRRAPDRSALDRGVGRRHKSDAESPHGPAIGSITAIDENRWKSASRVAIRPTPCSRISTAVCAS